MCDCEGYKKNINSQVSIEVISQIHGLPYAGEKWVFCPWCGSRLTKRAVDGAFAPDASDIALKDMLDKNGGMG